MMLRKYGTTGSMLVPEFCMNVIDFFYKLIQIALFAEYSRAKKFLHAHNSLTSKVI